MPERHSVSTEHWKEDGEQVTEVTVELEDGTDVAFIGSPGGPYTFECEGNPPIEAVEALRDHLSEDVVADDLLELVNEQATQAPSEGAPEGGRE